MIDLTKDVPIHFVPLFKNKSRYLLLKGGAGSGKSVFVTKKLVWRSLKEPGHKHLILRKVRKDLEDSIFDEVKKRVIEWKLNNRVPYEVNRSKLTIRLGKSMFLFNGLDDHERIKSISGITSITMEELSEFTEDDFDQVNLRLRGNTPSYKQTIAMFNPIHENLWMKRRFWDTEHQPIPVTLHESTYRDNPFLDEEYRTLLESYEKTNELYYQVYTKGEWGVIDTSNKFMHNFNQDRHVAKCELDPQLSIRLSFDFNIDPFVVTVYQKDGRSLRVIDKIRLPDGDIEQVCDHILSKYGEQQYVVTGDVSGGSRSGVVRGKRSYWQVVLNRLKIRKTDRSRVLLRSRNLDLTESRILCNLVLAHQDVKIDPKLTELISECKYAQVDDHGILVKDRKKQQNDFLDTLRYIFDAEYPDIIRKPNKYR